MFRISIEIIDFFLLPLKSCLSLRVSNRNNKMYYGLNIIVLYIVDNIYNIIVYLRRIAKGVGGG